MTTVFIALGSNIGNREENLIKAINAISKKVAISKISSIYETEPWGYLEQENFYNMVLEGETQLAPNHLLRFLKDTEREVGRTPNFVNGPRVLDLDILFFGKQVVEEEGLHIPHPRLHERAFVLVPLCEIAPQFIHPRLDRPLVEILADIDQSGILLLKKLELTLLKNQIGETMTSELKPLNWNRKPNIGYTVARRSDGGMNVTFTDLNEATIADWRDFSIEHLMGSDRLTRNLYDLREVVGIPDYAKKLAIEVNSDPSTRNLRVAVLVASQEVKDAILTVAAGVVASGAAIKIFTNLAEAEEWLAKSVEQIV